MDATELYIQKVNARLEQCNVRKSLSILRSRWENHGPASPICLSEMVTQDVTIAEFCVLFLLSQRARRNGPSTTTSGVQ